MPAGKDGAPPGIAHGDRFVFLRELGPRGRQGEVLGIRRQHAVVRLDSSTGMLALARDLHPIPRRPKPDFD